LKEKKTIKLLVKSDCYRELDQEFDVDIKISAKVAEGDKFKYHAEDEALDRQPSMYRQMMNSFMKKDDSDEELEEDAKDKKSPGKGGEVEEGEEELEEEEEKSEPVDTKQNQQPNKQDTKDKKK